MKSLIIILCLGFLEFPIESKLTCMEQGSMWLDMHTTHQESGSTDQDYIQNKVNLSTDLCVSKKYFIDKLVIYE